MTDPVIPDLVEPDVPEQQAKAPDQDIYDALYSAATTLGYTVYPHNPPAGTAYPFVRIGEVQIVPRATKSWLLGTAFVMVDVWGDGGDRRLVSEMANNVLEAAGQLDVKDSGYLWALKPGDCSIEIMTDNSTDEDLWRARLSLVLNLR